MERAAVARSSRIQIHPLSAHGIMHFADGRLLTQRVSSRARRGQETSGKTKSKKQFVMEYAKKNGIIEREQDTLRVTTRQMKKHALLQLSPRVSTPSPTASSATPYLVQDSSLSSPSAASGVPNSYYSYTPHLWAVWAVVPPRYLLCPSPWGA